MIWFGYLVGVICVQRRGVSAVSIVPDPTPQHNFPENQRTKKKNRGKKKKKKRKEKKKGHTY
jgi:hypothetical protein